MKSPRGFDLLPDELLLETAAYFNVWVGSDSRDAHRHVVAMAGTSRRAHRVLRNHPEYAFHFCFEGDIGRFNPTNLRDASQRLAALVDADLPIRVKLVLADETSDGINCFGWVALRAALGRAILGGNVAQLRIVSFDRSSFESLGEMIRLPAPAIIKLQLDLGNVNGSEIYGQDGAPVVPATLFGGHAPLLREVSLRQLNLPQNATVLAFRGVQNVDWDGCLSSYGWALQYHFPCAKTVSLRVWHALPTSFPDPTSANTAEDDSVVRRLAIIFENLDDLEQADKISQWTRCIFPNLDRLVLTGHGSNPWQRTNSIGESEALDFIDEYVPWESDGLLQMSLREFDEPQQQITEYNPGTAWRAYKERNHIVITVQQLAAPVTVSPSGPIVSWDTEVCFMSDVSSYEWLAKRIVSITFPYSLLHTARLFARQELAELYPCLRHFRVDVIGFTHRVRRPKVFDKLEMSGDIHIRNDEAMVWSGVNGVPDRSAISSIMLTIFTSNGAKAAIPQLLPSRIAARLKLFPRFSCVPLLLQNAHLVDCI